MKENLPLSATEMVAALNSGKVSALELCDDAIARIDDDVELNAVVVKDFDRAREQAKLADQAIRRKERKPLLGVPMTVKESFNVAGLPTSWGLTTYANNIAQEDAVAVTRLKSAGAIILGKTNVAQALGDFESNNPVYGRTVNPIDRSRTPGGSSGGSAAALAAGLVPLELGSDIGGSIRAPAHFCGVMGHKSTYGLIPIRGHELSNFAVAPDPLAVIGPMARSAEDLQLALNVLAGPDDWQQSAYRLELRPAKLSNPQGLRVLVVKDHPIIPTSAEVAHAVDVAAERLRLQGALISENTTLVPDLKAIHGNYVAILRTIISRGMPVAEAPLTAHQWMTLMDRRLYWQQQWKVLFDSVDVIIAPAFSRSAFAHLSAPNMASTQIEIDGQLSMYRDQLAWSGLATLVGLPATVAPVCKNEQGLPLGVQVIGPLFDDASTIKVAGWIANS
ncbi:amidase family protein [Sapientia aquatica]|uniref:Amidase n=1 Tax=Sapientia aquatica TaxID=1549640 RepID=A0A4R5W0V6_9BURK|nr:amidase family protein [Sapientia aquatica]TDK65645.1 amidase [Sapientia aquatica]